MIFRTHSIPAGLLSLLFFAALPVSVAALEAPSGEALAHGDAAFRLDDGAVVGPDKHLVFVLEPGGLAARSAWLRTYCTAGWVSIGGFVFGRQAIVV